MLPKIIFFFCLVSSCLAYYYRPCHLNDYACIGNVLSLNSACDRLIWETVPNELVFNNDEFQIPFFNITMADHERIIRNMDKCYVSAFFINEITNVAVLAIDCPNLELEAHRMIIKHEQYAQDVYYRNRFTQSFPPLSMTVNIQNARQMDLCSTFVYTYIDGIPSYTYTPDRPYTRKFIIDETTLIEHQRIFVKEEMLYLGQDLFKMFVNYKLCDFGCGI